MKDVLHIADQKFPMRSGTIGPDVIDISTLYGRTGRFTYDPSFTSTASCESRITYIDGAYDPRAKIIQQTMHEVLAETGRSDDLVMQVALELERIALRDVRPRCSPCCSRVPAPSAGSPIGAR